MNYIEECLARAEKATPGYRVLADGRIFSYLHNWRGYGERPLTAFPNSHGYLRVRLTIDGKRKSFFVHKLICEIYHGRKPTPRHEVCHIDGNRENNVYTNLRWGTRKDNAADRKRHGRETASINGKASAKKTSESMKKHWERKRNELDR